jgi:hypothetical protein
MTTQHTPGPWVIDGSVNAENLDVINSEGRIAMIDDSRSTGWNVPTINANARLISAAPDLLAALQDLLAATEETYDSRHERQAALDAIAKATGQEV